MTPERWKEVSQIYQAALAQPASGRVAFLAQACAHDTGLLREVQSLLEHPTSPPGLEWLTPEAVANAVAQKPRPSLTGHQFGAYVVGDRIGSGGMGDVYRGHDTRLGRDVAIKVLQSAFAADAERLARFEREARILATLDHPHIGAIYGVEESDGVRALVLALVEGETLAERLTRGAIPVEQALEYAREIADALETAHEKGVIHRDLKPANIKITADGVIKVLDFGLAKAIPGTSDPAASQSPLLTVGRTREGVILGTPAYMSPEQARGQPVDRRTDVWAFGCVVYEMLTGRQAFDGPTVADTLAAVVERDPEWSALPVATPQSIRRMLSRCLVKDPKQRLRDIGDARLEVAASGDTEPARVRAVETRRQWVPWIAATLLAGVLALLVIRNEPGQTAATIPSPLRLTMELGAGVWLSPVQLPFGSAFAISPDGAVVAFVGQQNDRDAATVYVRRLDELQPTRLAGTDGANVRAPFFSPDGKWIGYSNEGKLRRISVSGGVSTPLGDAAEMPGAAWGPDGTIVFTPNLAPGMTLWRVSSDGGSPQRLTSLAEGEQIHAWPQMLPAGKAVLYTASAAFDAFNDALIAVQPLPGGVRKVVHRGGFHGRYLPSGHLVYVHDGTLFAAPFDLDRLDVTDQPVAVLSGIASNATTGGAQFAVSDNGTLVYLPGQITGLGRSLQLTDRAGKTTPLRTAPMNWSNLVFARDGQRLAMDIRAGSSDIWVYEMAQDALTRVTSSPAEDTRPVWTPDGSRIVFASTRGGSAMNLYWQRADGTGEAERLTDSTHHQRPYSFHPSGRFLAFDEFTATNGLNVMILPMNGNAIAGWTPGTPRPFQNSPFFKADPMFSPDGRWLAYVSNESGVLEVHVSPFPGPGRSVQISAGGGGTPTWSRTANELFFEADGQIMVASYIAAGESFRVEKPRLWSERYHEGDMTRRAFDLHPDGKRFALSPVARTPADAKIGTLVVVSNFFDELRRLAPPPPRR